MTGNIRVGAVTFLPETGEAIFWRDTGNGAHELAIARRGASLVDYSTWKPGGRVDFDIYGRPVDLWILAVAAGPQHVPLPPFGTLGIGTPFVVMGQGAIPSKRLRWSPTQDPFPATFSLNLPVSLPIGTKGYMQALTADRVSQSMGSLTNVVVGMLQ
jgi:hypothetical protein